MLQLFNAFHEIDISKLYAVYFQSNLASGRKKYPDCSACEQLRFAEDDLQDYLRYFLRDSYAFVAVWESSDEYVSVLRVESYCDGVLVSGLETAPDFRNRGFAESLLSAVIDHLSECGTNFVYSHIDIRNAASLRVHEKCGFSRIRDSAVLIDGTVTTGMYTLCKRL